MKRSLVFLLLFTMLVSVFYSCDGNASVGTDTETETEAVSDTELETEAETEPVVVLPEYINPLTGLAASDDFSASRPVAIMINNLRGALPQEGIAKCDIMYECLVEGGITRLMVVKSDYESLGVIGSIRSSRHYYLDLVKNHDAIYVHAGGSDKAYVEIKQRGINNLDGVNMYVPDMFYRDKDRLQTMSYEHTLMTTGEKIANGIAYKKYRTELSEAFVGKTAFNFVEYGTERVIDGESANCIWLPYSNYQQIRFDYDEATKTYYRYQFKDSPHIDGTTGEQMNFTNLLILLCPTVSMGDSAGHLDITTESENGVGYYVYGGKCEPISWSKPTQDSPITYYGADGEELVLNRGKTFISIFPDYNKQNIDFNYIPEVSE